MVKIFVNNWDKLETYVSRIKRADLSEKITVEATIVMNDENAEKMWSCVNNSQRVPENEVVEEQQKKPEEVEVEEVSTETMETEEVQEQQSQPEEVEVEEVSTETMETEEVQEQQSQSEEVEVEEVSTETMETEEAQEQQSQSEEVEVEEVSTETMETEKAQEQQSYAEEANAETKESEKNQERQSQSEKPQIKQAQTEKSKRGNHKKSQEMLNLRGSVLAYFEERAERTITPKEILNAFSEFKENGINQSQVTYVLNTLQMQRKIEKVTRGRYRFIRKEERRAAQVSQPVKKEEFLKLEIQPQKEGNKENLKDLYHKQNYKEVMDYLFGKSEIDVARARRKFQMQEDVFVEVVRKLLSCRFIEEAKKTREDFRYVVRNVAKVWYNLLQKEQTIENLSKRIGLLSKKQIERAIDEGIQAGVIAEVRPKIFSVI